MSNTDDSGGSGNVTSSLHLLSKMRPKAHSFVNSDDVIFKSSIRKYTDNHGSIEMNLFQNISSLTKFDNSPKTRSFIRDFRKLFTKNRTSTDVTSVAVAATTANAAAANPSSSIGAQNEEEHFYHLPNQLRRKSLSWSQYEAQKIFRKCRKFAGTRPSSKHIYSAAEGLRNNRNMTLMDYVVSGITVSSKV